jgi:hypothetical protein
MSLVRKGDFSLLPLPITIYTTFPACHPSREGGKPFFLTCFRENVALKRLKSGQDYAKFNLDSRPRGNDEVFYVRITL